MNNEVSFIQEIQEGYNCKGDSIFLGAGMLNEKPIADAVVKIPLKTLNRHGLIAGATGTGKTKTLQILAENMSQKGIPVLLMDLKGDLSGLAQASPIADKLKGRHEQIDYPFTPKSSPVELLSLSGEKGVKLRATVSEFGPVLLSRILNLSDTQTGILAIIFKYCDDHKMPLLDLEDLKKMLRFITEDGKTEFEEIYGSVSKASTGAMLRKIVALEQQGADLFFGEPSFDVNDLMRFNSKGEAYINIIRLTDIQDKPALFSTFMLSLLAEVYSTFPEQGDADKPKLAIFIDEAHLVFKEASDALMGQIESIIKLIRSKGVGVFFVTQNPTDVPKEILSQLGLKVQHALRAFTARDRKAIKLTAENYPISSFYKTEETLTQLGIGEAFISALDEKGRPTPLAATMLRAPMSRMDVLQDSEIEHLVKSSRLVTKYNQSINRESAYEILNKKIEKASQQEQLDKAQEQRKEVAKKQTRKTGESATTKAVLKVLTSATFIRGVMSILNKAFK